jgi:hypothetical protein
MGDNEPLPCGTSVQWLSEDYGWLGGTVVGYDNSVTIVRHNDGYKGCHAHELRLPPTAEQIAAAERNRTCDHIYGIITRVKREGNRSDMAEAIYDAGYRKVQP